VSADEVLTGIGPVFALADLGLRWTLSDMGISFPVLRLVPVAAGARLLLMKKAPRDGVPMRLWLGGEGPISSPSPHFLTQNDS